MYVHMYVNLCMYVHMNNYTILLGGFENYSNCVTIIYYAINMWPAFGKPTELSHLVFQEILI